MSFLFYAIMAVTTLESEDAMKNALKKELRSLKPVNFLLLLCAGVVNAIGVTMFLAPVRLYDSGISGTSMLLWQVTPEEYTLSLFLLILNIPLFLFGLKKQGAAFTIYSVFAVTVYSAASFVITNILPVDVSTASPFAGNDLLLCALFGGLISGIGSGMTIRFGGAIDGVEVMAVIFSKRLNITVGTFVMIYNVLLYIVCGVIMGEVLTAETRELRGGEMQLLSFAITDYTNTIKCKAFLRYKPRRGRFGPANEEEDQRPPTEEEKKAVLM